MKSYTIEPALDRAAMCFEWRFEGPAGGRTRLTQCTLLKGENAAACLEQVQAGFTSSLLAGINKIAAAMARAEVRGSGAG